MSIWKGGNPLFAGNGYAGLSETCLYFIGGVIKHAKALNAFTNPTTNSYKRLVPGFEAPVLLAYSSRNRSASCRIPTARARRPSGSSSASPTPPPTLSGLCCDPDGRPRRHPEPPPPGDPMDKNLYDLPPQELATSRRSAAPARGSARAPPRPRLPDQGRRVQRRPDRRYMELKWEEQLRWETTPSPVEYDML
jgi:glutamine synthetase